MTAAQVSEEYVAFARGHIRQRVGKLSRSVRFRDMDSDDLEQEILLYVCQCLPKYDPTRGSIEAFTNKVVTSKIRNLLDPRSARMVEKRRVSCSLDDLISTDDGARTARYETLDSRIAASSREGVATYTQPQIDLKIDIDRMMETLPPALVELCAALMKGNRREISEELQLDRREVTRRVHKLRGLLELYWSEPGARKVAHFLDSVCKD